MKVLPSGSLYFQKDKNSPVFVFEKGNYNRHCLRHSKLSQKSYLIEIEKTLFYPDCTTKGPAEKQKNYYRTLAEIQKRGNIEIHVLKIPVFRQKRYFRIATAFDFWAYYMVAIHYLEKIKWKKRNSPYC